MFEKVSQSIKYNSISFCPQTFYVELQQTTPPISGNFLILPLLLSRYLKQSRSVLRKQIVIKIILTDIFFYGQRAFYIEMFVFNLTLFSDY